VRYCSLLLASLLLPPSLLPAQPLQQPDSQLMIDPDRRQLDEAWSLEVGPPVSNARFFRTHGLRLLTAGNSPDGPQLFSFSLRAGKIEPKAVAVSTEGLPPAFNISAMEVVTGPGVMLLAGMADGGLAVFRANLNAKAEVEGAWERLPAFPDTHDEDITEIRSGDDYAVIFTERRLPGRTAIAGWAIKADAPLPAAQWISMPPSKTMRRGYTALMVRSLIVLAGGVEAPPSPQAGQPAQLLDQLRFAPPEFSTWERRVPPVERTLTNVVGTSFGSALVLTQREPETASSDTPTSQTIHVSVDLGDGTLGPWHPMDLKQEASTLRAITLDAPNSHLITVTELGMGEDGERLRLTASPIPTAMVARRPTRLEAELDHLRQLAIDPPRLSREKLMEEAAKKDQPALLVITEDQEQDVRVRAVMGGSRYRYMTQGLVTSYFTGADGQALLKEYGVQKAPAWIVVDKEGRKLSSHSGSIPDGSQLFALTQPARAPRPELEGGVTTE